MQSPMEFLYHMVLKEGWLPPKMPNTFLLLAAKLQVRIHPMSVPNGPNQQYQHMLRKLCKFAAHQIIWKQESLDHMDKHWGQSQCFTCLTLEFLVLLNFFCRLGAEQHIKVLGQVIGPSPQFQIIMNHIPAIWFQI